MINIKDLSNHTLRQDQIIFTGCGAVKHEKLIRSEFPRSVIHQAPPYLSSTIAAISRQEYARGRFIEDLHELTPSYIRKPDAEINFTPSRQKQGINP